MYKTLRVHPPPGAFLSNLSPFYRCDEIIQEFKNNITTQEWDNLRVVILGSHMARHGELFVQYFGKALDTRVSTGERIIYAESLDTEGAMDLLGTHIIDGSVGQYFWNRYAPFLP